MCFFFFKQKTSYDMRISDWSSDVCSSDLIDKDTECGQSKSVDRASRLHPKCPAVFTAALCRSRPKSVLSRSRARDCRGPRIRGRAHSGCPEVIRDKKVVCVKFCKIA